MNGARKWFTSFSTWIGGVLLAVVLLPEGMGHWVVIGYSLFWLMLRGSGPLWRWKKRR